MVSKKVNHLGKELHYWVAGEGNPIILIHGFAENGLVWKHQMDFLSKRNKVIAPDIFGSGQSAALEGDNIKIVDYAKGIKKIIEAEKIEKALMIGHSMGGYIALAYYDIFPNDISGLGLLHSTAFADDPTKVESRNKAISFLKLHEADSFLKVTILDLFYNKEKNQSIIDQLLLNSKEINSSTLIQYYEAMKNRPDASLILKHCMIPVLIIAGLHDKTVPISKSLEQSYIASETHFYILNHSAHMGLLEDPDSVNKILSLFSDYVSA